MHFTVVGYQHLARRRDRSDAHGPGPQDLTASQVAGSEAGGARPATTRRRRRYRADDAPDAEYADWLRRADRARRHRGAGARSRMRVRGPRRSVADRRGLRRHRRGPVLRPDRARARARSRRAIPVRRHEPRAISAAVLRRGDRPVLPVPSAHGAEQRALLASISSWLRPDGLLLAVVGAGVVDRNGGGLARLRRTDVVVARGHRHPHALVRRRRAVRRLDPIRTRRATAATAWCSPGRLRGSVSAGRDGRVPWPRPTRSAPCPSAGRRRPAAPMTLVSSATTAAAAEPGDGGADVAIGRLDEPRTWTLRPRARAEARLRVCDGRERGRG